MLPKWHLFFGLVISLILFPFFSWQVLLFLAATVLIDFDHYLIYMIKRKDLGLKTSYAFFRDLDKKQKNQNFKGFYTFFLCIFHTYEFLLILFILSFIYNPLLLIFLGFIYHLAIDIVFVRIVYNKKYLFFYLKNFSLVYHLFTRNKKRFGEIKLHA